jgi:ATP-dependent Clp protease ATP-binding subunit ClpA
MFERFSNNARHVVVLAQEEARRLQHNYIGTEHILLGLLGVSEGVASRVLTEFGISLEGTRKEVAAIVGPGTSTVKGHIPFTPRAKKILEISLREAVRLRHDSIATEHILLAVIRESDGVGVRILKEHADLEAIRMAVLSQLASTPADTARFRRWLRHSSEAGPGEAPGSGEQPEMQTTPAADVSLSEAARLAGSQPVGSHHLLLAALADPETAAARALAALGVDLEQAREALRTAEVAGSSDEPPEEAGRRQMLIRVTGDKVTLEAADPVILGLGRAALDALGDQADPPGVIRGDLRACASLTDLWQALQHSLQDIHRRAGALDQPGDGAD